MFEEYNLHIVPEVFQFQGDIDVENQESLLTYVNAFVYSELEIDLSILPQQNTMRYGGEINVDNRLHLNRMHMLAMSLNSEGLISDELMPYIHLYVELHDIGEITNGDDPSGLKGSEQDYLEVVAGKNTLSKYSNDSSLHDYYMVAYYLGRDPSQIASAHISEIKRINLPDQVNDAFMLGLLIDKFEGDATAIMLLNKLSKNARLNKVIHAFGHNFTENTEQVAIVFKRLLENYEDARSLVR